MKLILEMELQGCDIDENNRAREKEVRFMEYLDLDEFDQRLTSAWEFSLEGHAKQICNIASDINKLPKGRRRLAIYKKTLDIARRFSPDDHRAIVETLARGTLRNSGIDKVQAKEFDVLISSAEKLPTEGGSTIAYYLARCASSLACERGNVARTERALAFVKKVPPEILSPRSIGALGLAICKLPRFPVNKCVQKFEELTKIATQMDPKYHVEAVADLVLEAYCLSENFHVAHFKGLLSFASTLSYDDREQVIVKLKRTNSGVPDSVVNAVAAVFFRLPVPKHDYPIGDAAFNENIEQLATGIRASCCDNPRNAPYRGGGRSPL